MGVAIPQEFRPEMAMAGEWQVISEKTVGGDGQNDDTKAMNKGVRKRKFEGEDEELENIGEPRKAWGSAIRKYPGGNAKTGVGDGEDLDALLNRTTGLKREVKPKGEDGVDVDKEEENDNGLGPPIKQEVQETEESPEQVLQPEDVPVKNEGGSTTVVPPAFKPEDSTEPTPKPILDETPAEPDAAGSRIVFKKRKPKQTKR